MTSDADWQSLGAARYVALSTFRRTGVAVVTPVWIAPDGDGLVVTTTASTGKAKRLRNDPHVRLQPCSRSGRVDQDAITVDAAAVIAGPVAEQPGAEAALARKYGWQFRGFRLVEGTVRRLRRRGGDDVILRITRS